MTYRAISPNTTPASPLTLTKPAGTAEGDWLVVRLSSDSQPAPSLTLPTGWSVVSGLPITSTAEGMTLWVCVCVAGPSEPASYDFTPASGSLIGEIVAVSGRDIAGLHRVSVANSNTLNGSPYTITTAAFASVTTAECTLLIVGASDVNDPGAGAQNHSVPTGFTEAADVQSSFYTGFVFYKNAVAAGATGVHTLTGSPSGAGWAVVVLAFAIAPTLDQEGFRFGNDDGDETTRTWLAAQDTNVSVPPGQTVRVRILVNGTDDPPNKQFQLEYRPQAGGAWRPVQ